MQQSATEKERGRSGQFTKRKYEYTFKFAAADLIIHEPLKLDLGVHGLSQFFNWFLFRSFQRVFLPPICFRSVVCILFVVETLRIATLQSTHQIDQVI
jgi:hypothetical protein